MSSEDRNDQIPKTDTNQGGEREQRPQEGGSPPERRDSAGYRPRNDDRGEGGGYRGDRGDRGDYGDRGDRGDRGGYRGGGRGGGGGGRSFFRRKVCRFCTQNLVADYKNPDLLRRFVTERGKILPRRITGTCAKHQRNLSVQIKRARTLAFLPFTKH